MSKHQRCYETSYNAQDSHTKRNYLAPDVNCTQNSSLELGWLLGIMNSAVSQGHTFRKDLSFMSAVTISKILIILFWDLCFVPGVLWDNRVGTGTWTFSSGRGPMSMTSSLPWDGLSANCSFSYPWRRLSADTERVVIGPMRPMC